MVDSKNANLLSINRGVWTDHTPSFWFYQPSTPLCGWKELIVFSGAIGLLEGVKSYVEAYFDACDEFRAKKVKAEFVPGRRSFEQTCCTIEKSVGKRALFAVR